MNDILYARAVQKGDTGLKTIRVVEKQRIVRKKDPTSLPYHNDTGNLSCYYQKECKVSSSETVKMVAGAKPSFCPTVPASPR